MSPGKLEKIKDKCENVKSRKVKIFEFNFRVEVMLPRIRLRCRCIYNNKTRTLEKINLK